MTYLPRHFAESLVDLASDQTQTNQKILVKNFLAVIDKHQIRNKLPEIVAEAEKIITQRNGGRMITLEVARNTDALVKMFKKMHRAKDTFTVVEKPELIAGARLIIDNEFLLDCSLKHRLSYLWAKLWSTF